MNRKQRIHAILSDNLEPLLLQVEDESHTHHVPAGAETHFKVVLVSEKFQTISRVERHRLVNKLLTEELKNGLHALSLHLYTPEEWERQQGAPLSPSCRDGYRHKLQEE